MVKKLVAKLAAWKLAPFFHGKKTYTIALAGVAVAVAMFTDQDHAAAVALLGEGAEADPSAIISLLVGLGFAALKAGAKREAAKADEKLDALIETNNDVAKSARVHVRNHK